MSTRPVSDLPRVVIAGGGVAALETLAALQALAPGRAEVTLVAPGDTFHYRALEVAEPFGLGVAARHQLTEIAGALGARFENDSLLSVAPAEHEITLRSGRIFPYDRLVLAAGVHRYPAYTHGLTFDRPVEPQEFDALLADVDDGFASSIAVVVPDEIRWTLPAYELALMLRAWATDHGRVLEIHLITHEVTPLAVLGASASKVVADILERYDIELHADSPAIVMSDTAIMASGRWLTVSRIVALPRVAGTRIPGLPRDDHGFLPVDDEGAVVGVEDIFAAGDGTDQTIKQGGLAAQQADRVAGALARWLGAETPRDQALVLRAALGTPDGPVFFTRGIATADGELAEAPRWSNAPLWSPPTKVASRHLAPFLLRCDGWAPQVAA
jgi:sulfide:quinone oxidoreductase